MQCVHVFDLSTPPLTEEGLRAFVQERGAAGDRLLALFAEEPEPGRFLFHAVLGGSAPGAWAHACAELTGGTFGTLTDLCPGAHWFEREVYDLFGLVPIGHPEPNPLRFHEGWDARFFPLRGHGSPAPEPRAPYRFLQVRGEGIHEVAVGPVHAGIIEPGHFRFSCAGETIQNLEIRLGYQHKGTESLFPGPPGIRQILLAESVSGDTAVAHANACARLLEAIVGRPASPASELWRSVALEIERVANHCGDLGGLATDIGYLFGAAHFARLRGTALNLLMRLTGNRFGRGLNRIGAVAGQVPGIAKEQLIEEVGRLAKEVERTGNTMLDNPSVGARMDGTGRLFPQTARTLQVVGPAGRASGRDIDARRDFPSPCFAEHPIPVVIFEGGDVAARARIRFEEMRRTFQWLGRVLSLAGPNGSPPERGGCPITGKGVLAVSVEEGWRGEVVHAAICTEDGAITRYKVVDPSFHNWPGLSFVVKGNVISDFPLCNKSFNLSYSGADL
jgi:Ni,Fe-hydrogenase III large subunit/Ni,Fe-hydrogenase III component G